MNVYIQIIYTTILYNKLDITTHTHHLHTPKPELPKWIRINDRIYLLQHGGWMWWTAGLDRYGPAVWTAEPKIWTAELDRRNYCLALCVKPILRSTEPVLWSILRSDPRSTPWSITNGFAHTPTHIYIPLHPCVMAMTSHPCTMCSWCA